MKQAHYHHRHSPSPASLPEDAVPAWLHPTSRAYLSERGLSKDEVEEYDLHYSQSGYWKNRVIIPIYDKHGKLIAFQGRIVNPEYTGKDRYLTEGPRPLFVPWEGTARLPGAVLVLVEGPFDVISVNRVLPAAAILGSGLSVDQITQLFVLVSDYHFTQLLIWLDHGELEKAYTVALKTNTFIHTQVVLVDAKDPGELSKNDVKTIIREYI